MIRFQRSLSTLNIALLPMDFDIDVDDFLNVSKYAHSMLSKIIPLSGQIAI